MEEPEGDASRPTHASGAERVEMVKKLMVARVREKIRGDAITTIVRSVVSGESQSRRVTFELVIDGKMLRAIEDPATADRLKDERTW